MRTHTFFAPEHAAVLLYVWPDLPTSIDDARVVRESALRSDVPGPSLGAESVTRIAPASRDGQISVPRVVDDEA